MDSPAWKAPIPTSWPHRRRRWSSGANAVQHSPVPINDQALIDCRGRAEQLLKNSRAVHLAGRKRGWPCPCIRTGTEAAARRGTQQGRKRKARPTMAKPVSEVAASRVVVRNMEPPYGWVMGRVKERASEEDAAP